MEPNTVCRTETPKGGPERMQADLNFMSTEGIYNSHLLQ